VLNIQLAGMNLENHQPVVHLSQRHLTRGSDEDVTPPCHAYVRTPHRRAVVGLAVSGFSPHAIGPAALPMLLLASGSGRGRVPSRAEPARNGSHSFPGAVAVWATGRQGPPSHGYWRSTPPGPFQWGPAGRRASSHGHPFAPACRPEDAPRGRWSHYYRGARCAV
jgi:hypothetical protein